MLVEFHLKNYKIYGDELISKVAQFVVGDAIFRDKDSFLEQSGINFSTLLYLQEIGILAGVEAVGLSVTWGSVAPNNYMKPLISNSKVIILEHDDKSKEAGAGVYQLTSVGRQVLALASFGSKEDYLQSIAKDYAKKGFTVKIADWKYLTPKEGRFFNAQVIEA